jgi:hypothetical protein
MGLGGGEGAVAVWEGVRGWLGWSDNGATVVKIVVAPLPMSALSLHAVGWLRWATWST